MGILLETISLPQDTGRSRGALKRPPAAYKTKQLRSPGTVLYSPDLTALQELPLADPLGERAARPSFQADCLVHGARCSTAKSHSTKTEFLETTFKYSTNIFAKQQPQVSLGSGSHHNKKRIPKAQQSTANQRNPFAPF